MLMIQLCQLPLKLFTDANNNNNNNNNTEEMINAELNNINEWLNINKLTLNKFILIAWKET